jgi:hypothetical protein
MAKIRPVLHKEPGLSFELGSEASDRVQNSDPAGVHESPPPTRAHSLPHTPIVFFFFPLTAFPIFLDLPHFHSNL